MSLNRMYWATEDQLLFLHHMEKNTEPKKMALIFKKSVTAVRSKATRINNARQRMADLNITQADLIRVIVQCDWKIDKIRNRLGISSHMIMSFIHSHPEIHSKINAIKSKEKVNYAIDTNKKTTIIPRVGIIKVDENAVPTERNYLEQAEQILKGRITRHPKLGRLLDGERKSVKQILEAAGINDPALYL